MNVGELKKELEKYPDDMDVFVAERKTEFANGLVNSVYKKNIPFSEDPEGEPLAYDDVLIIDEE